MGFQTGVGVPILRSLLTAPQLLSDRPGHLPPGALDASTPWPSSSGGAANFTQAPGVRRVPPFSFSCPLPPVSAAPLSTDRAVLSKAAAPAGRTHAQRQMQNKLEPRARPGGWCLKTAQRSAWGSGSGQRAPGPTERLLSKAPSADAKHPHPDMVSTPTPQFPGRCNLLAACVQSPRRCVCLPKPGILPRTAATGDGHAYQQTHTGRDAKWNAVHAREGEFREKTALQSPMSPGRSLGGKTQRGAHHLPSHLPFSLTPLSEASFATW